MERSVFFVDPYSNEKEISLRLRNIKSQTLSQLNSSSLTLSPQVSQLEIEGEYHSQQSAIETAPRGQGRSQHDKNIIFYLRDITTVFGQKIVKSAITKSKRKIKCYSGNFPILFTFSS